MSYNSYEEYDTSDIIWAKQIPSHWKTNKFKIVFSYSKGKNPQSFFDEKEEGLSPYLSMEYLRNDIAPTYVPVKECPLRADAGDILLLWDGSNAGEFVISKDGLVSSTMAKLTPNIPIDKNFSKYLCKLIEPILRELTIGMGVPHVSSTELNNIVMPNIPLDEQKQIANYLDKKTDKIDETITKNQHLIELLEEKRVALINHVVTKGLNPDVLMKDSGVEWIGDIPKHWDVDCLKHNVNLNAITLTDTTDSNYEFDYVDIGSVSLENGIEKYEHMIFEDAPSRARRIVKKDDVIISTVRTYLKAIAIIPDKENIIVSTGFAVLTPTTINSRYLGYIVKSEYFTNLVSAYSVGVSYPAINSTDLVNLDILIPSDEEQKQIANYLDKEISNINNIINKVSDNIALLEEYKTSLIHHVVTGKIDIRGEEL